MQNLNNEYLVLFRAVTETEELLTLLREKLIAAQQLAEEVYLSRTDA